MLIFCLLGGIFFSSLSLNNNIAYTILYNGSTLITGVQDANFRVSIQIAVDQAVTQNPSNKKSNTHCSFILWFCGISMMHFRFYVNGSMKVSMKDYPYLNYNYPAIYCIFLSSLSSLIVLSSPSSLSPSQICMEQ